MHSTTELNRKKREEATDLLKEGYTVDQVMKATGMGKSTVYAVRQKVNRHRGTKKLEYQQIPGRIWADWDYTVNTIGIPKHLREEWDSLNRRYGKREVTA